MNINVDIISIIIKTSIGIISNMFTTIPIPVITDNET